MVETEEEEMAVEVTEAGEAASDHRQSLHRWADATARPRIP